jgi:phytoene dehydrogenase-like protein
VRNKKLSNFCNLYSFFLSFVIVKSITIIGAGVAGLAAASYLARKGYRVTVFEKNAFPGGRCASFTKDGHRFDIGATLLMMP